MSRLMDGFAEERVGFVESIKQSKLSKALDKFEMMEIVKLAAVTKG